jgi:hypothetical protein
VVEHGHRVVTGALQSLSWEPPAPSMFPATT